MKVESLFLIFLGAFFGAITIWYWFWGYEQGGTMLLVGTATLGFLPGFYYFFWHRRFHGHKYFFWGKVHAPGDRPSDRDDAEMAEGRSPGACTLPQKKYLWPWKRRCQKK